MNMQEIKRTKNLLIGATGAISVLNLHMWIAHMKMNLFDNVRVMMTEAATRFVNPQVISSFANTPVYTNEFGDEQFPAPHVSLTEWADIMLIIPASANILGKAAHGIADDLVSSSIVAASCPVLFVPSMNDQMWQKPAVQRNVRQLQEDGYHVVASKVEQQYRISTGQLEDGISIDITQVGVHMMRLLRGA